MGRSSDPSTIAHLRTGKPVAAWLLKAAPGIWDLDAALRDREPITEWGLVDSYRVSLVEPGQPVGIWRTRGWSNPAGVAAIGHISGPVFVGPSSGHQGLRFRVPIAVEALARPASLDRLRSEPSFASAEVIRAPRVSSPIALTPPEWATVLTLVRDDAALD